MNDVTTRRRVLHVTVFNKDEVRTILRSLGQEKWFDVRQMSFDEFAAAGFRALSDFDILLFGIGDAFWTEAGSLAPGAVAEVRRFVEAGGGLVWTHDTLCAILDLHEMSGFRQAEGLQWLDQSVTHVRVRDPHHAILAGPYHPSAGKYKIAKSKHTGGTYSHPPAGMIAEGAEIVIDHDCSIEGPQNFYLTTHSWGHGRVVAIEVGHEEIKQMGEFERELFVNSLYWAASTGSKMEPATGPHVAHQCRQRRWLKRERIAVCVALSLSAMAILMHYLPKDTIWQNVLNLGVGVVPGLIAWFVAGPRRTDDEE